MFISCLLHVLFVLKKEKFSPKKLNGENFIFIFVKFLLPIFLGYIYML